MLLKIIGRDSSFAGLFEVTHVHREVVGGFLVWVGCDRGKGKVTFREGDIGYIYTDCGKYLETIQQSSK